VAILTIRATPFGHSDGGVHFGSGESFVQTKPMMQFNGMEISWFSIIHVLGQNLRVIFHSQWATIHGGVGQQSEAAQPAAAASNDLRLVSCSNRSDHTTVAQLTISKPRSQKRCLFLSIADGEHPHGSGAQSVLICCGSERARLVQPEVARVVGAGAETGSARGASSVRESFHFLALVTLSYGEYWL